MNVVKNICCMIIVVCGLLPSVMSGMFLANASRITRVLPPLGSRFKHSLCSRSFCENNKLKEKIIWDATKDPKNEKNYACHIEPLLRNSSVIEEDVVCCDDIAIHLAVQGNLPIITELLLKHNPRLVSSVDVNGSLPIDFSCEPVYSMLKKYGSRDKSFFPHIIKAVRVPAFGWLLVTPLRRACYEGDLLAVMKMMQSRSYATSKEREELNALAFVSYWRSRNPIFLKIACYVEHDRLQNPTLIE